MNLQDTVQATDAKSGKHPVSNCQRLSEGLAKSQEAVTGE